MKQTKILIFSLLISLNIYAAEGTLDPSFSGDGIVTTDIPGTTFSEINDIAIQQDGKIVAVGDAQEASAQMTVARYNTNGSLDTTFGNNGIVINIDGFLGSIGNSVAIQNDKIYVAGSGGTISDPTVNFTVVRLNEDGTLDTTFNGVGFVKTDIGTTSLINEIIVTDNAIYAGGQSTIAGITYFTVAKYNLNGSLDTTFNASGSGSGVPGVVVTQIDASTDSRINDIVLQDGKIVAVGQTNIAGVTQIALARYNENGTLDTTFNSTGAQPGVIIQTVPGFVTSFGNGIALQNGQIVIVGTAINAGSIASIVLVRYNIDGSLDTTFGNDGIVLTNGGSIGNDIEIQRDNKIVVAGAGVLSATDFTTGFLVVRYNVNGSLDTTFNPNGPTPGKTITQINTVSQANAVLIQQDNKIVLGGFSGPDFSDTVFTLARYIGNVTFVTITSPTNGQTVVINQGQPLILTGTMEVGNTIVTVSINGQAPVEAIVDSANGTWTLTTTNFNLGTNSIVVTTTDPIGNSASATVTFNVQSGCILTTNLLTLAIRNKYIL
jgi:uncharacterized delta-60 repeat protein